MRAVIASSDVVSVSSATRDAARSLASQWSRRSCVRIVS